MKNKLWIFLGGVAVIFSFSCFFCYAETLVSDETKAELAQVDTIWEENADTNNDGIVDKTELEQWKAKIKGKTQVDTQWEEIADTNNDGKIDKAEFAQWKTRMKDKSQVNTRWEAKADTNDDGHVDKVEANQWRGTHKDNDNNPPGAAGGAGTNWENPPGPKGGKGASPNRRR